MRIPEVGNVSVQKFKTIDQTQLEVLRQIAKSLSSIEAYLQTVSANVQKIEKQRPSV